MNFHKINLLNPSGNFIGRSRSFRPRSIYVFPLFLAVDTKG